MEQQPEGLLCGERGRHAVFFFFFISIRSRASEIGALRANRAIADQLLQHFLIHSLYIFSRNRAVGFSLLRAFERCGSPLPGSGGVLWSLVCAPSGPSVRREFQTGLEGLLIVVQKVDPDRVCSRGEISA